MQGRHVTFCRSYIKLYLHQGLWEPLQELLPPSADNDHSLWGREDTVSTERLLWSCILQPHHPLPMEEGLNLPPQRKAAWLRGRLLGWRLPATVVWVFVSMNWRLVYLSILSHSQLAWNLRLHESNHLMYLVHCCIHMPATRLARSRCSINNCEKVKNVWPSPPYAMLPLASLYISLPF